MKRTKKETSNSTLRFDLELKKRALEVAVDEGRTFNGLVAFAVNEYIKNRQQEALGNK
jgi:hypothetical protein